MSTTLNLDAMTALLQARLPFNPPLTKQFCYDRLNEAYRWLEQRGSFVWDATTDSSFNLSGISVNAPSDLDPGKVIHIYGTVLPTEIPFVPINQIGLYQKYNVTAVVGIYYAYTIISGTTPGTYKFMFAPDTAFSGPPPYPPVVLLYHRLPAAPLSSGTEYFPTPDQFDDMYVDLAEAETKRRYGLSGWDIVLQKAQAAVLIAADAYRTDKNVQPGLEQGAKEGQEKQLMRAE